MSSFPITPKKICPFTPLVSPYNHKKSISPPPDINIGVNSTPLPSASGMFLLICNILPVTKTGFAKPIELVKKVISEIVASNEGCELACIPVVVILGGRPQDAHSSSAYLELAQEVRTLNTLPRSDLLIDWKNTLIKARPEWEVVWAPQTKGRDRRMTVCFCVADSKEKIPASAPDKICLHLKTKGHRTIGGYVSFNGLVDVTLADTCSVDLILASNYYAIPSLSKELIHVSPPKFIPILNPFELTIGGLGNYKGLHETIEKWLYYRYNHDDDSQPTCVTRVFETRISDDREHYESKIYF